MGHKLEGVSSQNRRRLPQEIYRRRRIAAIVALLVVVALLIWLAVSCSGGGDEEKTDPVFSSETNSWQAPAPETTSAKESEKTSEKDKDKESESASSSKEPKESETVASNGKRTCEPADLRVTAQTDRPGYSDGTQPTFYMTVANPTEADCEIDLTQSPLRFEVYDMATNARVWSDIDCNKPMQEGRTTFKAGEERHFEAVWSRTTSEPEKCSDRQAVPAASYYLHAVLGDNPSAAQPFNLS